MILLENYWCEDKPTIDDIKQAYAIVTTGKVVKISWSVPYSGIYDRIINKDALEVYPDPKVYFYACIPQCYPV